jgi:hypothetical protein
MGRLTVAVMHASKKAKTYKFNPHVSSAGRRALYRLTVELYTNCAMLYGVKRFFATDPRPVRSKFRPVR